jgi:hypothetical protein
MTEIKKEAEAKPSDWDGYIIPQRKAPPPTL